MKFLFPKQSIFFELIGKINGCQKEMAETYHQLIENFDEIKKYCKQAKEIEHKADEIAHQTIDEINKIFVTP